MKECCSAKTLACCNKNVILSSEHVTKICTCILSAVGFLHFGIFCFAATTFWIVEKITGYQSVLLCTVLSNETFH